MKASYYLRIEQARYSKWEMLKFSFRGWHPPPVLYDINCLYFKHWKVAKNSLDIAEVFNYHNVLVSTATHPL